MNSLFCPYEKVWIREQNLIFPGIIINAEDEENITVYKFDTVIWRRISISKNYLTHRLDNFSQYMFETRSKFMNLPIKFVLPS